MPQIITSLPTIVTTADLPDAIDIAIDGASAELFVMAFSQPIFQTTLFSYNGLITLYDLRSVMEDYLLSSETPLAAIQIWVNDSAATSTFYSSEIYVLYSQFSIPNSDTFFRHRFLTTRTSFGIHRSGSQYISYLALMDEHMDSYTETVTRSNDGTISVNRIGATTSNYHFPQVISQTVNVEDIAQQVSGQLLAFTIHRGQRSLTFYVTDEDPDLRLSFRNAFNTLEIAEIFAATTVKQKINRSEANILHTSSFYDQTNETSYEVETSALPYEDALWLNQLISSQHVMKDNRDILITDSDSEISDSAAATNRHKFTYKFARNEQPLQNPTSPQLFTSEFQPQFQ